METTTKIFEYYDEKKHSVRYNEIDSDESSISSSIYFSKQLLGKSNFPNRLRVTVEEG